MAVAADWAAVSVNGNATPGVADSVDGVIVTPVGSPDVATAAAPLPTGAVSSREACCPAAPAFKLMLDGVSASVGWLALLLLLLLLHEDRQATSRLLAATEKAPPKNRYRRRIEKDMATPGECSAVLPAEFLSTQSVDRPGSGGFPRPSAHRGFHAMPCKLRRL